MKYHINDIVRIKPGYTDIPGYTEKYAQPGELGEVTRIACDALIVRSLSSRYWIDSFTIEQVEKVSCKECFDEGICNELIGPLGDTAEFYCDCPVGKFMSDYNL